MILNHSKATSSTLHSRHIYTFLGGRAKWRKDLGAIQLHVLCPRHRTKLAGSFVLQPPNPLGFFIESLIISHKQTIQAMYGWLDYWS